MNVAVKLDPAKPLAEIKGAPEHFQVQEIDGQGRTLFPVFETKIGNPEQSGFTKFLLTKRDLRHEYALDEVARQLGVDRSKVTVYGKKDACAVTVQHLVVQGPYDAQFNHDRMWLHQLGPAFGSLYRGGNHGNFFTIFVQTDAAAPPKASKFMNVFGPQRFGDGKIETGRLLLDGQFEEAAQELLDSAMNGRELRDAMRSTGLDAVDAMLSPAFEKRRKWKLLQWQSHLWNQLAADTDESVLPFWKVDTAAMYLPYWQPDSVDQEIEAEMHQLRRSRQVWIYPQQHQVSKVPGGFRHRFGLPSGAYATQFLDTMYDYIDLSREKFNKTE